LIEQPRKDADGKERRERVKRKGAKGRKEKKKTEQEEEEKLAMRGPRDYEALLMAELYSRITMV
jgi:hypothetical protein